MVMVMKMVLVLMLMLVLAEPRTIMMMTIDVARISELGLMCYSTASIALFTDRCDHTISRESAI